MYPPHTWRGRYGGYQPPDGAFPGVGIPGFLEPPPPPFMGGMGGYGAYGPPPPLPFNHGDGPGPPPPGYGGPAYGGGGGGGFWGPWMDAGGGGCGCPACTAGGGGAAPWGCDDVDGGDDDDEAPPAVTGRRGGRNGVGMIYNPKQTRLHIFKNEGLEPWLKDGCKGAAKGGFNMWDADVNWTVRQLMEYLGKGDDKWAVTEVTEAGNGRWYRGTTFKYKEDRAKEGLSKQGWTEKRGAAWGQQPVWLVVHKAD